MKKKLIEKPDGLVVLSLFDGLSGGRLALEGTKIKVAKYIASEIKPFAVKHTLAKFPDTIQIGDVSKVFYDKKTKTLYKDCEREIIDSLENYEDKTFWDEKELKKFKRKGYEIVSNGEIYKWTLGEIAYQGEIDLLIGGSPCTQFSFANSFYNPKEKYGLKGDDSKLFYEYHRILKEVKPTYFFLENVKMKKESEQALNEFMGVDGIHINSNLLSYQNRHRIYWTNIPEVKVPENQHISFQDYIIRTIPRIEQIIRDNKFKNTNIPFNLTSEEIETIYNNNLWAFKEFQKITPTITKEEFVGKIHDLLYEATPKKVPSRDKMWNNGKPGGNFVSKNITNAPLIRCLTTKQDRSPNSGCILFGDYFRFLTSIEACEAQKIPYSFLCDLKYSEILNCTGDGWTNSVIQHIFNNLKNVYKF